MQEQAGRKIALETAKLPVFRILGHNPGPMTGPGTNSYLIEGARRCLLDPGPVDARQLQCFLEALDGASLDFILVTHTHRDHSPGARALKEATGAQLVGLPVPDAMGQDHSFVPDIQLAGGECLDGGDYTLEAIHTPGHVSNHLCFLLREEKLLFTGDHVLQGTTPVILPPDGDMKDYMDSLAYLLNLDLAALAPGHGEVMRQPREEISALIAHRHKREQKVIAGLRRLGESSIESLVQDVYDDVPGHLIPWAKKTLLAHLLKLEREGQAVSRQVASDQHWGLHDDGN